jgi:hypothetical protein
MPKEYIIYCDESETKGRRFSNFYGGALVSSDNVDQIRNDLAAKKLELNLFGEIKWSKISVNYYKKYIDLIDCFFDMVAAGKVKIRIMFTQNAYRAHSKLSSEHHDNQYAILYYYFIRHAFGIIHCPFEDHEVMLRIYADRLPLNAQQVEKFKDFLVRLNNRSEFRANQVVILRQNITEVISHEHDILQCLDVVLGAMNFKLNRKNRDIPEGATRRSAKTLAKEKVYDAICTRIRDIYPNFNIGITTGHGGVYTNRWNHAYRHWNFRTAKAWR